MVGKHLIQRAIFSILIVIALMGCALSPAGADSLECPRMVIQFDIGTVVVELRPDKAPRHVARIRELANAGFYDGLTVIRVAPGHVVQAGDPKFDGNGGSGQTIKA